MNTAARKGGRPLILLTRPADRAAPLANALEAAGADAIIWPLLDIQTTLGAQPDTDGAQAVLFTSARAIEAAPGAYDLPAFCVGRATAHAARAAGYHTVHDANGDADDLAALVTRYLIPGNGPLLYLRGRDVSRDMSALLPSFQIAEVEVYRAVANPTAPPEVHHALSEGRLAAIAFFSPRTATIFTQALSDAQRVHMVNVTAVAMSARVAEKLSAFGFRDVAIAAEPTATSMHAAICGACGIALR